MPLSDKNPARSRTKTFEFSTFHTSIFNSLKIVENLHKEQSKDEDNELLENVDQLYKQGGNQIYPYKGFGGNFKLSQMVFPGQDVSILAIITSAVLIESIINWINVVLLEMEESEFDNRKINLFKKWNALPAKKLKGYQLPENLQKDLKALTNSRNAITHHKPEFEVNRGENYEGNIQNIFVKNPFVCSIAFALPLKLCKNMFKYGDSSFRFYLWNGLLPIYESEKGYKGVDLDTGEFL